MSSCQSILALAKKIAESYCEFPEDEKDCQEVLPEDKLLDLAQESNVRQTLQDAAIPAYEIDDLVDFVCNDSSPAQRVFLILVMMTKIGDEKLSLLRGLRASRVDDGALPIGFYKDKKYPHLKDRGFRLENDDL